MGTVCMGHDHAGCYHIADVKKVMKSLFLEKGLPVQVLAESIGTIPGDNDGVFQRKRLGERVRETMAEIEAEAEVEVEDEVWRW